MDPQTQTEQAPQASVEDRIASMFGPPVKAAPKEAQEAPQTEEEPTATAEAAGEEPVDATPVEETFEMEVDGEKFTLPKKLEKGFLQEKDYTQKSQTLAEQRRSLEMIQRQQRIASMNADFEKETATEAQQLKALKWALDQPIEWAALNTEQKLERSLQLQEWERNRVKLESSIEDKRKDWGSKQAAEISKLRAESLETIKKRIPGWSETTAKELRDFGLAQGMTDEELNSIIDPRHVQILWQAQQYEKLKGAATRTVQSAKAVKTTPSNPMPQQVKDKLAFRKEVSKHAQGSQTQQALVKDRIARIFG